MKLYVGCALTHAPEEFQFKVEELKRLLAARCEVLEFLGTVKGTPRDVYRQDIQEHTSTCDMLLAICDYPAIGLGYELAYAVEKRGIPVLAVAHKDAKVSRLVLGIDRLGYTFARYQDLCRDVPLLLDDKMGALLEMHGAGHPGV